MNRFIATLGYIDPNTSQHVFSLLGPILACLATMSGLAVTAVVLVRHRITSYFQRASRTRKAVTISGVVGLLLILTVTIWLLLSGR
jgi:hypothetical protein